MALQFALSGRRRPSLSALPQGEHDPCYVFWPFCIDQYPKRIVAPSQLLLWQDHRMLPDALVYEERYHWTRTSVSALAGCSFFVLFGILIPQIPLPLRVVIIACSGCGAFLSVIVPACRKVALRIDANGITLGGSSFLRYKATTRVVPWHEVQRVLLWRRVPGVRYPGVERPVDAPPLSPGGAGQADRPAFYRAPNPQIPSPTLKVGTTRGMQAFSVDDARLSEAIAHYAPSVSIVNLG